MPCAPSCRRLALAASLFALLLAGCAGSASRGKRPDPKSVAVAAQEPLYVCLPEISDSVHADIAALGWGGGRFQGELREEIIYQFNRKGVPTVADSSAAAAVLAVRIEAYGTGRDAAGYRGKARLKKPEGEREFGIGHGKSGADAPARSDPTVDNIRSIAESVVSGARKAPKKADAGTTPIKMWMIF